MHRDTNRLLICLCAALAGLVTGSLLTGSVHTIVSAPAWVETLCAFVLGTTAMLEARTVRLATLPCIAAMIFGSLLGVALPVGPLHSRRVVTGMPARVSQWYRYSAGGDESIFNVLDALDEQPQAIVGHKVVVEGQWRPAAGGELASVSRRLMTCCAADAVDVGFSIVPSRHVALAAETWVSVRGVVQPRLSDGAVTYVLEHATVISLSAKNSGEK